MSEGSIVTFYSYKGGVGRTLAMASTATLLSLWGYRVLCVDWDLEAPGLHLYFERWIERPNGPGLIEFIQAEMSGEQTDWLNYTTRVRFPGARETLRLMSAGVQNESYIQRMQALDWKWLYEEKQLGNFLEGLRQRWKEEYDFVLIDSRTGITDIGGICTIQLPDLLVLLFTANSQSLYGAVDVANRATQQRNNLPFDRARLMVLPIVTRFEARIEYELAQEWLDTFSIILAPLYAEWSHRDVKPEELLNFTKLPYVPYWSFGERVPVLEEGTRDPESLGFALETLTALVANALSSSDLLISNRDSYVAAARRGPARQQANTTPLNASRGVQVFLSYSFRDEPLRDQLAKHLSILQRRGIIGGWHDRVIGAGIEQTWQIDPHLEEAGLILLLLSADYLASSYAYDVEILRAMERHEAGEAVVVPILLRPVDWRGTPFDRLQMLPQDTRPVTSWPNPEEAFVNISQGIQAAAERLLER